MSDNFDRAEGARRKDDELERLAKLRALHVLRGRRALLSAMLAHGTATADDVRAAVDLPARVNPVCLGAVAPPFGQSGNYHAGGLCADEPPDGARPPGVSVATE